MCLKWENEFGIKDILMECLRVSNDHLIYMYDTWMKSSQEILQENGLEI